MNTEKNETKLPLAPPDWDRFFKFLDDDAELGFMPLKIVDRLKWYINAYFKEELPQPSKLAGMEDDAVLKVIQKRFEVIEIVEDGSIIFRYNPIKQ
jgi:hypothetical protein